MMKKLQTAVLAIALFLATTSAFAGMFGMGNPGMYNLTVAGLAGRDNAKGIDEKFSRVDGVQKVHVDYDNGMIMIWVKKGGMLDRRLAKKIVENAGFELKNFEPPK